MSLYWLYSQYEGSTQVLGTIPSLG